MLNRRFALIAAAAALAAGAALAAPVAAPDDMSLGNPKAKIEIIEYASLSCPHCGHFNDAVFPALKAKYIDTGKVRYTLKEMLTEPANVAAAGFLLARCAGPDKYFTVVDQVFRSQPRWTQGNVKPILVEIGAANGVDAAHFDACLQNQAEVDAVVGRAKRASDQDGVNSTPTLFINGKKIETVPLTPQELDATIAAATKGGR
ncbi:DsbA family protein [Phenylobacterium sp.]|jgi:protein-disulfide isomerase|uniref:DsbA family protein n=1 Tax=Phenylobacterium sp. TaxID=1871053 RepID=UPI002E339211|nr:DsbA family protein [Phenylobacterium sp.]HEX3364414.1 DsbA family protein [Phenylobacterium sp.]